MTNAKLSKRTFKLIHSIRLIVRLCVDMGHRKAVIKDYPCVAVVCSVNDMYGYGYSRQCNERLQKIRPVNNKIISDKSKILKRTIHNKSWIDPLKKYFWGSCAEDMAATCIMRKENTTKLPLAQSFGKPRRVRTGIAIPMCDTCKALFK